MAALLKALLVFLAELLGQIIAGKRAPDPEPEREREPVAWVEAPQPRLVARAIPMTPEVERTVTLTCWAEARGEPLEGQVAVAWVIRNRAERPRWWGRSLEEVCLKPFQFSCWLPSDPQSKKLADPKTLETASYKAMLTVVRDVMAGRIADPTGGADHYCTLAVAPATKWAKDRKPIRVIGNHNFYRLEP